MQNGASAVVRTWDICVIGNGLRLRAESDPTVFLDTSLKTGNDARLLVLLLFSENHKRLYADCALLMQTRGNAEPEDPTQNARKARQRLANKLELFVKNGFAPLLYHDGQCIVLNRAAFTSDIEQAERRCQTARQAAPYSSAAKKAWHIVLAFCGKGEVLASWNDAQSAEFLAPCRMRLAKLRQEAFVHLAEIAEKSGPQEAALARAESALSCHTTDNEFTARASALIARIKSGTSVGALTALTAAAPLPLFAEDDAVHLPFPFYGNSFRGRASERETLNRLADNPDVRLVTLLGAGGVGKTRLVAQWATAWQSEPKTGPSRPLYLVNLAPLFDVAQVPGATAEAVGISPGASSDPVTALIARLREAFQPIVLFDNVEHLLPPPRVLPQRELLHETDGSPTAQNTPNDKGVFRGFLTRLLQSVPDATFFVTSRQALQLQAEHPVAIEPLLLPPAPVASNDTEISSKAAADVLEYDSVRLFIDRAKQVNAAFTVDEKTLPLIANLVRLLDGLPLALELVAGNTTRYPLKTLCERLSGELRSARLRQLAARNLVDGDVRHSSLWAAFSLSYHALTPLQKRQWSILSVFRGGADLTALRAVCWDGDTSESLATETDLWRDVQDFALRSLVYLRLPNEEMGTAENEPNESSQIRCVLLETLRAFGWEALPPSERAAVARRHAAYFLQLAEKANRDLHRQDAARGYAVMEIEHANLHVALDFLTREGQTNASAQRNALRMAGELVVYWTMGGHGDEGRAACERLLARPLSPNASDDDKTARIACLIAFLWLLIGINRFDAANDLAEQGLNLAREANAPAPQIAELWRGKGFTQMGKGDARPARESFQTALKFAQSGSDTAVEALALHALGNVSFMENEVDAAVQWYEQSLDLSRRTGYVRRMAVTLHALGGVMMQQRRFSHALPLALEALQIQKRLKNLSGILVASRVLGEAYLRTEDVGKARPLTEEALLLAKRTGETMEEAIVYRDFGQLALYQEDWHKAQHFFLTALHLFHRIEARVWEATLLCWCGILAGKVGQWEDCVALWHAAVALCGKTDGGKIDAFVRDEVAEHLARAYTVLSHTTYEAAQNTGAVLNWDAALQRAENLTVPVTSPA